MQHLKFTLAILLFFTLLTACTPTRHVTKKEIKTVEKMIDNSPVFNQQFTGFVLYDPEQKTTLINKNGDKYFTPASNTKILSLHAALNILGDSLPMFNYLETEEAFYFWGAGNPLFLHPDFDMGSEALDFLKSQSKPLRFLLQNFRDDRFGEGWMWDDYPYYYQVEKSAMPMYGNAVRFTLSTGSDTPQIQPEYFEGVSRMADSKSTWFYVTREEYSNWFEYHVPEKKTSQEVVKEVPFAASEVLIRNLLRDTLGKVVLPAPGLKLDTLNQWNTYSIPTSDSLFQRLMQISDNFIAEQLLLMCSDKVLGYQNTRKIIDYCKDNLLSDLADEPLWYDGSGLSRYNMFTPRSLVSLLDDMRNTYSEERIFTIFPAGGKSGTIERYYGDLEPYVFAKTGTLRNNHCLSGYLKTDSGQTLIFSFMNNHYKNSSDKVKKEMEKVLRIVKEQF